MLIPAIVVLLFLAVVISWIQRALMALSEWIDHAAAYVSSHQLLVGSIAVAGIIACATLVYGCYRLYRAIRRLLNI